MRLSFCMFLLYRHGHLYISILPLLIDAHGNTSLTGYPNPLKRSSQGGTISEIIQYMGKKILVVCYSFSNGNTRMIAKQLQQALGADYTEIETVTPYPAYGGFNSKVVSQGQREVDEGFQPEIKPLSVNVADYDVVAIGTPTWWYTMAPAVLTFLNANDWSQKTVIPFMTHGGWPGHVIKDIQNCCAGAKFLPDMKIQFDSQGGANMLTSQADINAWIERVKKAI